MNRVPLKKLVPVRGNCTLRPFSTANIQSNIPAKDFKFLPAFLSAPEQRVLLSAALQKLDTRESRQFRRLRKEYSSTLQSSLGSNIRDIFLPDEFYAFEEGHYDGVINRFREMHVSSWPDDIPGLQNVLERIHTVHPLVETQTHLIHLASDGEILPHVDNLGASGSWILGVSLGAERVLCLESVENPSESYELLLPSGSLYIQSNSLRFGFRHSVLKKGKLLEAPSESGQRLSVILRDLHPRD